jgi:histone demethylase JARID1
LLLDNDDNMSVDSDICEVCQKTENGDELLLCDGCNRGYHLYCLTPSLPTVPKSDWYCLQCLTAVGKDYGFEDGEEYSLTDFQKVCSKFKKDWFKKEQVPVTEEECEDEFWRLVENPHETCEVEYGADLHSTQHGRYDFGFIC